MPVIHVKGLGPDGGTEQVDAALQLIAREVAAVLGEEPRSTWCTFTAVATPAVARARRPGFSCRLWLGVAGCA